MRKILIAAMTAAVLVAPAAHAQPIVVVPGRLIDVPYFRMEWLPGGGAHIQAPFVNLYTAAPCHVCGAPAVTPAPAASSFPDSSRLDAPLAEQLFAAGRRLNRALDRFDTGPRWQNYFGLALGGPLSLIPVDRRPGVYLYPVASNVDLATILDRFDRTSREEQFRVITSLPEFEQAHRLLADYIAGRNSNASPSAEEIPPPLPTPADDRPQPTDL